MTRLLLAALLALPAAASEREQSLDVGGVRRWWLLHEPAKAAAKGPLPLVIVLHGGGGHPSNAERMSGMSELADREGFLAAYPAGTGRFKRRLLTWNAGNCCAWAKEHSSDDVGFLSAMIERLVKEGRADPDRVYVTGMSNGAMMTHRLACERADLVAAIAPVAGTVAVERCAPSRPVPVMIFHGRADQHVPYDGGTGKKAMDAPRVDRSVAESAAIWRKAGASVTVVSHDGGHVWPGGKPGLRNGNADPPPASPKATDLMWEFFSKRPRTR